MGDVTVMGTNRVDSTSPPDSRNHGLDLLRAVLLLLGILLHSANVYLPGGGWRVWDQQDAGEWANLVRAAFQLFRMPAFFALSGYLYARSMDRRDDRSVLTGRLYRLLVPLAVMGLTVNVAQLLLEYRLSGSPMELDAYLSAQVDSGMWIGHLWFLVFLSIYMILVFGLRKGIGAINQRSREWFLRLFPIVIPVAILGFHVVARWVPFVWTPFAGLTVIDCLDLFPYFLTGYLAGTMTDGLQWLARWSRVHSAALVTGLAGLVMSQRYLSGGAVRVSTLLFGGMVSCCCVVICFLAVNRWKAAPHPALRYLAAASYTIYLFHQIVVVTVAYGMIQLDMPVLIEYAGIVILAAGLPALAHTVIRRSPLLLFLFNGAQVSGDRVETRSSRIATRTPLVSGSR